MTRAPREPEPSPEREAGHRVLVVEVLGPARSVQWAAACLHCGFVDISVVVSGAAEVARRHRQDTIS
jgi:hypothetical protein